MTSQRDDTKAVIHQRRKGTFKSQPDKENMKTDRNNNANTKKRDKEIAAAPITTKPAAERNMTSNPVNLDNMAKTAKTAKTANILNARKSISRKRHQSLPSAAYSVLTTDDSNSKLGRRKGKARYSDSMTKDIEKEALALAAETIATASGKKKESDAVNVSSKRRSAGQAARDEFLKQQREYWKQVDAYELEEM